MSNFFDDWKNLVKSKTAKVNAFRLIARRLMRDPDKQAVRKSSLRLALKAVRSETLSPGEVLGAPITACKGVLRDLRRERLSLLRPEDEVKQVHNLLNLIEWVEQDYLSAVLRALNLGDESEIAADAKRMASDLRTAAFELALSRLDDFLVERGGELNEEEENQFSSYQAVLEDYIRRADLEHLLDPASLTVDRDTPEEEEPVTDSDSREDAE